MSALVLTRGAAKARWGRGAAPTPGGIVTRAAASVREHGGDTAATGSSCLRARDRIRSSRRTSSGLPWYQRRAAAE